MKHITSRLLALLLTVAMIVSIMPAVYAADEDVTIVENEQPTVEEPIVEDSTEDTTEDTTVEPAKAVEANLSEGTTTYVAKTADGVTYATLADAIAAAKDGETVTLLADVSEDVTINKSITLDLGGKTLTGKGTASTATLTIAKGATTTVKNGTVNGTANAYYNIQNNGTATFEDVTATAGNTGSSMIDNYGDLTITSGDYSGGLNVVKSEEGSTLTINGGKFTLSYAESNKYNGVILSAGTTKITDGNFTQSATTPRWGNPQVILAMQVEEYTSKIEITGGTFTNKKSDSNNIFHGSGKATSDNFEVSGGTFNKSVPDAFFKDGYIPVKNADGTYGVKEGKFVVEVGSTGYETFDEAIAAANASTNSKTIYLRENLTVDHQIVINNTNGKKITLNLKGFTLTSTYALKETSSEARYALVNKTALEVKNGTFAAGQARAIGGYAALTLNGATVTQTLTGGHACVAFCAADATYTIKNSTISGAYAVANFANNANITINSATLEGKTCGLYHNGSNYGLKLKVTSTTINGSLNGTIGSEKDPSGVYISGSASHGTMQNATFTNCTIKGATAIEVKYTDLTLDKCTVEATVKTPSYDKNSNGMTALGFAVVSTDNSKAGETPVPTGTVTITGEGSYKGLVGLGALESVKTNYTDFKDETIKVSGGTFTSAVLPEYCADGFVPTENADGSYGVKVDDSVAEVNGKKYKSLAEAIAAAENGQTVKLLSDVTITGKQLVIEAGKQFTLDLNGKTLKISGYTAKAAQVDVFGDLTLADSSKAQNGTICSDYTGTAGLVVCVEADGKLTMNGGTITTEGMAKAGNALKLAKNAVVTMNGGTVKCDAKRGNRAVNITGSAAQFTMTGGSVIAEAGDGTETAIIAICGAGSSTITISEDSIVSGPQAVTASRSNIAIAGGNFTGTIDVKNGSISGGTFDRALDEKACAAGFIPTENEDGTYGVTEGTYVAEVGGKKFASLEAAVAAANAGDTIKLLANVTLDAAVKVPAGKTVTLDLNGKKLSTNLQPGGTKHYYAIDNYGTFTLLDSSEAQTGEIRARGIENFGGGKMVIKSGKIVAVDTNGGAAIWNLADLTIQGGTFVAEYEGTSKDQYGPGCVYNKDGNLTINGGTFTSANKRTYAVVSKSGTVTIDPADGKTVEISGAHGGVGIDGGTATIKGGSYASSEYYGLYVSNDAGTAEVTVTDGTFTGKEYSAFIGSDGSSSVNSTLKIMGGTFEKPIHAQGNTDTGAIQVSGGTFSSAVPEEYCATGYVPQDNGNGTYGVTLAPPAPSGGGSNASVGRPSVREDAGQSQTAAEQTHFIDVPRDSWYYSSVYRAHENGLIDGVGGERFDPDSTLTVAQAIKLSAALHQLDRTGEVSLKNGAENWYDAYVSYAVANGILEERYAGYSREQMNAPVTRSEFVRILHGALEHYEQINTVADNAIPDVKLGDAFAAAIYELYRAGILQGNDTAGTFRPESTIKRSEAAAILLRMFEPSARKSFTLGA